MKTLIFGAGLIGSVYAYLEHLPKENVLFGFGRAGGGRKDHVVHYVDSEKPNGKRIPLVIGEIDGQTKENAEH